MLPAVPVWEIISLKMNPAQQRKYLIWIVATPIAVLATLSLLLISCIALFGDEEDPQVSVTNNSSQPIRVLTSARDDWTLPEWPVIGSVYTPRPWGISYLQPGEEDSLLVQKPIDGIVGDIHVFTFINGDTNTVIAIQQFSFEELKSQGMELVFEEPEN